MKKILISAIVFIGIGSNVYSQNTSTLLTSHKTIKIVSEEKSAKELKGDKFYFTYYFEKAIKYYSEANAANTLTTEGKRKLAESYQNMGQNSDAETIYSALVNSNSEVLPEDYYAYAMILKSNSKMDESTIWMEKFAFLKPDDLRSRSFILNRNNLSQMQENTGGSKVTNMNINSSSADFATSYYKNQVVFTSSRRTNKIFQKKYNWNRQSYCNMYVSEIDGTQLKNAEGFDKKINSKMHDGPASFSNDGTFMAFTKNHYKDRSTDKIVELQIYFSTFTDGKWSKAVPFTFNNQLYSVGHPSLSADGKTMYFTCDMPGGFGGSDIYKTVKDNAGTWQKPENLGNKINTESDEMFPFIEEKNGFLFFASNGHFGLGGFDVFYNELNGTETVNMGIPVNSTQDDFALILNDKMNKGYFSSNRLGGIGDDDIYSVDLIKALKINIRIEGIAKDINENHLPFTFITLKDSDGNTLDTLTTQEAGFYSFKAIKDKNYVIVGNKATYLEGTSVANTFSEDTLVRSDVILLQKEIVVNEDLAKAIYLNSIYFDFAQYAIRPDAALELDKIVKIMNQYPKLEVSLGSHTDCRGTETYNGYLSDYRATTSINYIKARISNPERISGKGYGETKLLNGCSCEGEVKSSCSKEEHQLNRRTEFIVIKK